MPITIGDIGHVIEHNAIANTLLGKMNTADNDAAVAGYINTAGTSATKTAVAGKYAPALVPVLAVADGVTDDTAAIQAVVNACPAGGVVDGRGLTYVVTTINLKSFMQFRNFNFITKAGAVNFVSPVTIGAYNDTTLRQNITIRNVHVNGNRVNQTGISGGEDGGRHGFRFIGRIENLLMEDCSATMCASDGWSYFHGLGMGAILSTSTGLLKNVHVNRSRFNSNRRHGMSIDSCDGVWFNDVTANGNGIDVAGGTEGAGGATYLGARYGNGMDIEEYAPTTYSGNIHFTRCVMVGNERAGMLALQASASLADDPAWIPRKGYTFTACRFDAGVGSTSDGYALNVTPMAANKTLGWYFDEVAIIDCTIEGLVLLQAVKNARHEGGTIITPGSILGTASYVESLKVNVSRSGKQYTVVSAGVRYNADEIESLWISATELSAVSTGPILSPSVGFMPSWAMRDGNNDRIGTLFQMPSDWKTVHVDLLWFNLTAATGAVTWRADVGVTNAGVTLASAPSGAPVSPTAAAINVAVLGRLRTAVPVTAGLANVAVVRLGSDAADTLVGGVSVLGVKLTRAS